MVELTTALLGANTLLLGAAELALFPTLYDPRSARCRVIPPGSVSTSGAPDGRPVLGDP